MNKSSLINLISFQIIWLVCVQAIDWVASMALLAFLGLHFLYVLREKAEYLFIFLFTLLGFVVETTINSLGLIHYANSIPIYLFGHTVLAAPIWLICLWTAFSTTFFHSLSWLKTRPVLSAVLIIASIPSSWYLGARLSNSVFPISMSVALAIITLAWLVIMPAGFALAERLRRLVDRESAYAFLK